MESLSSRTKVGAGVGVWVGGVVLLGGLRLLDELVRPDGLPGVFRKLTTHSSRAWVHRRQESVLFSGSRMHLSFWPLQRSQADRRFSIADVCVCMCVWFVCVMTSE